MKVVVQKVSQAKVVVDKKEVGKIDKGLMILVGFTNNDNLETIKWMAKKIVNLRIFPDESGIMNLSVLDVGGKILSVSQFTLYADATKGNRPSYAKALNSEEAKKLYEIFNQELGRYISVATGIFQAHMEVSLTNVGPTTIILEK